MDTLCFRLVRPTAAIIASTALALSHQANLVQTKVLSRAAACDYVPHSRLLSSTLHHLRSSDTELRPSANAFRLLVAAFEGFPNGEGNQTITHELKSLKAECISEILHRSAAPASSGESNRKRPQASRSAVNDVEAISSSGVLVVASQLVDPLVTDEFLSRNFDRASLARGSILVGETPVEVSLSLEALLVSPNCDMLLEWLAKERTVRMLIDGMSPDGVPGAVIRPDVGLAHLLLLLRKTNLWGLVDEATLESKILSRFAQQRTHVFDSQGSDSAARTDVVTPFGSAPDTAHTFSAMAAVFHPTTPLVVQRQMVRKVALDLFTLVTLRASSASLLASWRHLTDAISSTYQRAVLCKLLDDEAVRFLDIADKLDTRHGGGGGPASATEEYITHIHSTRGVVVSTRRCPMLRLEGYLLIRSKLAQPLSDPLSEDNSLLERSMAIFHDLEVCHRALRRIVMDVKCAGDEAGKLRSTAGCGYLAMVALLSASSNSPIVGNALFGGSGATELRTLVDPLTGKLAAIGDARSLTHVIASPLLIQCSASPSLIEEIQATMASTIDCGFSSAHLSLLLARSEASPEGVGSLLPAGFKEMAAGRIAVLPQRDSIIC